MRPGQRLLARPFLLVPVGERLGLPPARARTCYGWASVGTSCRQVLRSTAGVCGVAAASVLAVRHARWVRARGRSASGFAVSAWVLGPMTPVPSGWPLGWATGVRSDRGRQQSRGRFKSLGIAPPLGGPWRCSGLVARGEPAPAVAPAQTAFELRDADRAFSTRAGRRSAASGVLGARWRALATQIVVIIPWNVGSLQSGACWPSS